MTRPPALEKSVSTSRSGSRSEPSPTSNVFDEPMPITGKSSPEAGTFFVTMDGSAAADIDGRPPSVAPAASARQMSRLVRCVRCMAVVREGTGSPS
jgi:hypothetical protein